MKSGESVRAALISSKFTRSEVARATSSGDGVMYFVVLRSRRAYLCQFLGHGRLLGLSWD